MKETYKTSISCETSSKLAKSQKQTRCMFCLVFPFFSLFLCFLFLRTVLGRGVAVRGVILKNKKAGGGLGGGRSASPPDALGVVAFVRFAFLVLFFRFFPCSYVFCFFVLFLEEVWRWEESSLNIKKLEGGWGGGRNASPPDALGVVAFVRVACLVLFFFILLPPPRPPKKNDMNVNTRGFL